MREINSTEHLDEMFVHFQDVIDSRQYLILWQLVNEKRVIFPVFLSKADNSGVSVSSANNKDFSLEEQAAYFFCKNKNMIFKSELKEYFGSNAQFKLPEHMKLLDQVDQDAVEDLVNIFDHEMIYVEGEGRANQHYVESMVAGSGEGNIADDGLMRGTVAGTETVHQAERKSARTEVIDKYQKASTKTERISTKWAVTSMSAADAALFEEELSYITLEEEDKKFEGMRAAPRAKPPEGKMVTVQEVSGVRAKGSYLLYDLSRGGFSFLVFNQDEFKAGEVVHILAFDTNKFDQPMIGEVKSVREADELGVQFKVGCQFVNDD